ncbi:FUSC family protein [Acidisoma cellulosilytica]|uniref:FUSC family protein n=1 Tax=Acidisoma cellulosilyticum TaxID=2802395 RepID=A0A964E3K6_9PROT|nr:FUSC family protein [Acidisoma cellulosilyticum]MCB8880514.1 FUSC family protein [Acidisoma cellulosilyticum]
MTALKRSSFALDFAAFSVQEGVRAGLSVAALVVLHAWFDFPLILLTALGALLTCLADAGTPGRERLPALFAFAVLGAAIGVIFGLARAQGLYLAIPLAGIAIFMTSFARIYGPAGMQVGNLLSVWIVLAIDVPQPSLHTALISGGMFFLGSLWAIFLTSVIWRIQTTLPFRHVIGDCYRSLAGMTQDMREILAGRLDSAAAAARWEQNARVFRGGGRVVIETARTNVMTLARTHGSGPRVARAWLRLEAADQAFSALSGMADLLEAGRRVNPARAGRILRHLRNDMLSIAHNIDTDEGIDLPRLTKSLNGVRGYIAELDPYDPLRKLVETIAERLFVAASLTAPENLNPGTFTDGRSALPWPQRVLGPIHSNLNRTSSHLRHAGMAGLAALLCLSYTLQNEHEYERWLTITLLMTMQPHFSLTWQRMLERIGGTVLGGLIASALSLFLHTPLTVSLAMFPLAVIAFTLRKVSFGLFLSALTPMVILLVESSAPGASEINIALMRALYTIIGGVLALVCSLALWPGRQPQRALSEVRAAIAAHAKVVDTTLALILGESDLADWDSCRRQCGMTSNMLESALSRSLLEPRLISGAHVNAALTIDAALRRIMGRSTVLRVSWAAATTEGRQPPVPVETIRQWRQWCADCATRVLSENPQRATEINLPPRPTLDAPADEPVSDSLRRIARQIELIAGAMPKLRS